MAGQPIPFQLDGGNLDGIRTGKASINDREIPVYFFKQLTGGGTTTVERAKLVDHLAQTFAELHLKS